MELQEFQEIFRNSYLEKHALLTFQSLSKYIGICFLQWEGLLEVEFQIGLEYRPEFKMLMQNFRQFILKHLN